MRTSMQLEEIKKLLDCRHSQPFQVLGPHKVTENGREAVAVRGFFPESVQAWVVPAHQEDQARPMRRIHPAGVYEALCPATGNGPLSYRFKIADKEGNEQELHDPYAFPLQLTDYDLYLLSQGTHWHSYEKLGAHVRTINGVQGVNFAIWAPNADAISVVGNFNSWDGRRHPMQKHQGHGYWELFIPGLDEGEIYKYRIFRGNEYTMDKADPYGFAAELPPYTASKVVKIDKYQWNDQEWLSKRYERNSLDAPMSIYEVHLGSWKRDPSNPNRWLSYKELAPMLADYVKDMGYTHIELMPVHEHPLTASWGYQPVGLYAVTSRYGTPEEFQYFVDYMHQNDIGVIIDWVPGHFPKDDHGLRYFDGTHLYEHSDPRQGEHREWGTMIYNYGRWEVKNYLTSNALFWIDKYHIDGLRVDAVASMIYLDYSREEGDWIPNEFGGRENLQAIEFIKQFNIEVHRQYPGAITAAEESTSWSGVSRPTYVGGLGFTLKWNMGWMNDTLEYFSKEAIHRKYHHNDITFSMIYAFHENFVLPLSHDEVVHGKGSILDKMPGDLWQKNANVRLLYGYMWAHPGKKLLFMGGDIAQWSEWRVDESLQWHLLQWESHQGVQNFVRDLNTMYRREKALHEVDFEHTGFEWIDCHDSDESTLSFIRRAKDPEDFLVVACNFTPVLRTDFRLGVPEGGYYKEILNSDSEYYGGSNQGNYPGRMAEAHPYHGRPYSIGMTLPPLGLVIFKPERQ